MSGSGSGSGCVEESWLIGSMQPGETQLETVLASSCLCSGQSLGSSRAGSDGPRITTAMMAAAGRAQAQGISTSTSIHKIPCWRASLTVIGSPLGKSINRHILAHGCVTFEVATADLLTMPADSRKGPGMPCQGQRQARTRQHHRRSAVAVPEPMQSRIDPLLDSGRELI